MPFPKKYSNAQIMRLYEEYRQSDKDLKTFCIEKQLPYTTIYRRFDRLERQLAKGLPPPDLDKASKFNAGNRDVAEEEVASTVQQEIAAESKTQTQQYIILGKKIWESFAAIASKKGYDLSKLRGIPIHEVVMDALEKADQFDKLAKEHEKALAMLNFYQSRLDPIVRLEQGIQMLQKFLEMALLLDSLGVDIISSETGEYYAKLIEDYLLGRPLKAKF